MAYPWDFDADLRALVHDSDSSFGGELHKFSRYLKKLAKEDAPKFYAKHKDFLRIFAEEFPDPNQVIERAPLAVVYQVLSTITQLDAAQQNLKSKKAIEYQKQLINALTLKAKAYHENNADDYLWALFEHLSNQIMNDDQELAEKLMKIYQNKVPSDEQIERNEKKWEKANSNQAENNKTLKKDKKNKNKNSNSEVQAPQTPQNPLLTAIIKLQPTSETVNGQNWQPFFMSLCKEMVGHMTYKEKHIESYDLLMHKNNEAQFKKLLFDAILLVQKDTMTDVFSNKQLLLLIIGKFNDGCIQCQHTPIVISMPVVKATFSEANELLWNNRNRSNKTKEYFFYDIFPKDYLEQLTQKHRYELRAQFETTLAKLPPMPARDVMIAYCSRKLGPETDPTPAVQPLRHVLQKTDTVPIGTRNEAWGKFISKVYDVFAKDNPVWGEQKFSEDVMLQRLQPIVDQFKIDFPTEAERAQAQRFFISFINSADCTFAKGAEEYAWLFLKEMIPQSTNSPLSQREAIDNLKKEVQSANQNYKKAEQLILSCTKK
jgi:hypothetical protein